MMFNLYYLNFVTLIILNVFGDLSKACCPDGWISYRAHCYLIGYGLYLDFVGAEHYCNQHGAHLVQVDDSAENLFLKDFLRKTSAHYTWLGLTDESVQDVWKWYTSRSRAEYFDWAHGEPNGGSEHCVVFYDKGDYQWADYSCNTKVQPLCEMRSPTEVNLPVIG